MTTTLNPFHRTPSQKIDTLRDQAARYEVARVLRDYGPASDAEISDMSNRETPGRFGPAELEFARRDLLVDGVVDLERDNVWKVAD